MKIIPILLCLTLAVYGQSKRALDDEASRALELLRDDPKKAIEWINNSSTSAYDFGMTLLSKKNSREALEWFSKLSRVSKSEDKLMLFFGKAWTHYHRGEISIATEDGLALLKLKPKGKLKARTHHLLAVCYLARGDHIAAKSHIQKPIDYYRSKEKKKLLFRCLLVLADGQLKAAEYEQAEATLEEAREINDLPFKRPIKANQLWDLYAELNFRQARYRECIEYNLKALENWSDPRYRPHALMRKVQLGLCYALVWDFDEAWDYATEVDKEVLADKLVSTSHYNNLTWIYMNQCTGKETVQMSEALEIWAKNNKNQELVDLLKFIEQEPCPE